MHYLIFFSILVAVLLTTAESTSQTPLKGIWSRSEIGRNRHLGDDLSDNLNNDKELFYTFRPKELKHNTKYIGAASVLNHMPIRLPRRPNSPRPRIWTRSNPVGQGGDNRQNINTQHTAWGSDSYSWTIQTARSQQASVEQSGPGSRLKSETTAREHSQSGGHQLPMFTRPKTPVTQVKLESHRQPSADSPQQPLPPPNERSPQSRSSQHSHSTPETPRSKHSSQAQQSAQTKKAGRGIKRLFGCFRGACRGRKPRQ